MRKMALILLIAPLLFLPHTVSADNPGPALSSMSGYRVGDSGVLTGFRFPPDAPVRIDLSDPTGAISVYPGITDAEGSFILVIPLTVPGTFRADAVDRNGKVVASALIPVAE